MYDRADLLTDSQEDSLEVDLQRAARLGHEMLVYTRMSDDAESESQAYADRLRVEWDVESSTDADDGLVYLLTVNPAAPETNTILMSAGAHTFPIRQLDLEGMQQIVDSEMAPAVSEGSFSQSLLFGVRRLLNFSEYSPPDPPERSMLQDRLFSASTALTLALVQVTILAFFLIPTLMERHLTLAPTGKALGVYALVVGALAVAAGIIAIAGRNTAGSLIALGVVIWTGCGVPLLASFLSRYRARPRQVRVASRAVSESPLSSESAGVHAIGPLNG